MEGSQPFLKNLTVLQSLKNFPHITEPEISLPCAQQPATLPYPKSDESSSQPPFLLLEDSFQNYPSFYAYVFQLVLTYRFPPPKS